MKLSIIVPIYNVEKYLRKCVDSLLNQDIPQEEYEILLIDDGSPDNCGKIADGYAAIHHNIRVIHQKNGGLSAARNTGIDAAKGDYLCFVDSDDYWEKNVLDGLMKQIESENLDVLRFNFQNVDEDGMAKLPGQTTDPHIYQDYSDDVTTGLRFIGDRLGIGTYAWQFILKHSLCKEEMFTEGLLFEDLDWTPRMLMRANRVSSTNQIVYNYLTRTGSITKAVGIEKKHKILDYKLQLIKTLIRMKSQVDCQETRVLLWFDGMVSAMTLGVIEILSTDFYHERIKYIQELQTLNLFPLSTYHIWPRALKKIHLINLSPYLALYIMHKR